MITAHNSTLSKCSAAIDRWVSNFNPYQPDRLVITDRKPVVVDESAIQKRVLQIMLLAFGGFLIWASFAPLDAGVHIAGKVSVSGKRKEVAHPNGGVVQQIFVAEGDSVKQGQVLLAINPLTTEASLNDAELEYINAMAVESRLIAERDDQRQIEWNTHLVELANGDPRAKSAMAAQQQVFNSGQSERLQAKRILTQKIANSRAQLIELQNVLELKKAQLVTITQEAESSKALAAEGYVPLSVANDVERQRNSLLTNISASVTQISDTQNDIAAGELELIQRNAQFKKEVNAQLAEAQKQRKSMVGKVQSLQFDRALTEVKAPASGVVVGLKANTVGGVIKGADILMEIVPEGSKLVVEAKVPPVYIDKVSRGMVTDMRFTAFNVKTTPVIEGRVQLVSADLLPSDRPDEEYYLALVETSEDGMQALDGLEVQPGMPVDVIVKNGERTFMSYLLKPLTDSVALSFKD